MEYRDQRTVPFYGYEGRNNPPKRAHVSTTSLGLVYLYMQSILFNDDLTWQYLLNTILQPIFNFMDNYLRTLSPFLTAIVFVMLKVYIVIAYAIGIPYWYERSPVVLFIAFIIGHWILLNAMFHYYMSLITSPGYPSDKLIVKDATGFCRKCIRPKPPRAHHCSICDRCIIKMDHHCPWLNNCIGHFNHRYYFLFCVFTWIGTFFVMIFGVWVLIDEYFPQWSPFHSPIYHDSEYQELDSIIDVYGFFEVSSATIRSKCITYEIICTIIIFLLLGALLRYHVIVISRAETCIERHINEKNTAHFLQYNLTYKNPYDFGVRANWRSFLGLDRNRRPFLALAFPSTFQPAGDGFTWRTIDIDLCSHSTTYDLDLKDLSQANQISTGHGNFKFKPSTTLKQI